MKIPTYQSARTKAFALEHKSICYWCDQLVRLDVDVEHPLSATREHLLPLMIKPKYSPSSFVLAHRGCNERRAVMNAGAFKRLMQGESVTKYDLWPHEFKRPDA